MTLYIAMDIGCIECGESSNLVGVFKTETEANVALKQARKKQEADWMGEHSFEVFTYEL